MRNLIWKLLKACLVTSFLFAFVVFFYTTANTATEVAPGSAGTIGPAQTQKAEEEKAPEVSQPPKSDELEIPFRPTISEEEYKKAKEEAAKADKKGEKIVPEGTITVGPAETRTPEEVKKAEALRPPGPVGGEIPFRPTISEEEYKKAKEKATLEKGEEKTNHPPDVKEPGGPNAKPPSKGK